MTPKEKAIKYANLYPQFQELPYDIMEHILDIALEEQAKEIFKSVESYIPYNLNKITGWKQVKQKYGVKE